AAGICVLANYLAQVPYDLHLYGTRYNPAGAALLALTLAWFLTGFLLLLRGSAAGYLMTLGFAIVDFVFYLFNAVNSSLHGFGPLYHLSRFDDPILWVVFLVGYVNFVAAGYLIWLLLRRGPAAWR
ncbi:MAG TPA: hypothetical protein VFD01_17470, partial [Candidatus Dormibacteraeota bacterium]|nr:hypothetical protein [Candidatus Dormibacteraeota bacterium]